MNSFEYPGLELPLFSKAKHWKHYLANMLSPYLGINVVEVGGGMGSMTRVLCDGKQNEWLILEPDKEFASIITQLCENNLLPRCCNVKVGTLNDLPLNERFDTIIYIDVLEHIWGDLAEVSNAAHHLSQKGHLIIVSPAIKALYSPFDKAIGHFRRYSKKDLVKLKPDTLEVTKMYYLDSVGLFLLLANKLFLKSPKPTEHQIDFWDNIVVPLSRLIDPCIGNAIGRSVVGIWRKL